MIANPTDGKKSEIMAGATADDTLKFSGGSESLGDMVFGFLDEESQSSCNSGDGFDFEDCGTDGEEGLDNVEGRKAFWEEEDQLLQVIEQAKVNAGIMGNRLSRI